jgi:hypothetical protein
MRLGQHVGATLRVERFDVSVAYAHVFQFDETVERGCYPRGLGSVINAGTYRAEYNLLSLSLRYHFN